MNHTMKTFKILMLCIWCAFSAQAQKQYSHKNNLAVHYWTINDRGEMRMLIDLGADGIMTDYPHRLAEVYAEYTK